MDYSKAVTILGLRDGFDDGDLKKSYRNLSRRYHPDIAGDQYAEKFKEVAEAYNFLKDPNNRVATGKGVFTHLSLFTVVKN